MRKVLFWMHLTAGVVCGIVILIMCVTGASLAFEKQINAWLERSDARVVPAARARHGCRLKPARQGQGPKARCTVGDHGPIRCKRARGSFDGARRDFVRESLHGRHRRPEPADSARSTSSRKPKRGRSSGRWRTGTAGWAPRAGIATPANRSRMPPTWDSSSSCSAACICGFRASSRGSIGALGLVPGRIERQGSRLELAQHDRRVVLGSAGAGGRQRRDHVVSVGEQSAVHDDGQSSAAAARRGREDQVRATLRPAGQRPWSGRPCVEGRGPGGPGGGFGGGLADSAAVHPPTGTVSIKHGPRPSSRWPDGNRFAYRGRPT